MSAGGALALKLVLTPVLVGAASLVGRRWGPAVGGWLIGIPFTSGPIAFFLALNPGPHFAAAAAAGTMAGATSQAAFCLGYAWAAQRSRWPASVAAAALAFAATTAVLNAVVLPAPGYYLVVVLTLVVALFLMPPAAPRPEREIEFPAWDLPARMVIATAFVIGLTAVARALGPHLAGLVAPFPLYATVIAAFAHRMQGAASAVGVVRGLLLGLFAFASFFLTVSLLLPNGIALAFAAAIAVALVVQGASLFAGRRLGLA